MHEERVLLYESGEMDRVEAEVFERHLSLCGDCRERLSLARQAHAWSAASAEMPPSRLIAGAVARVRRAPARAHWAAFLRPLSLAACAAGIGVFFFPGHQRRPAPAAQEVSVISQAGSAPSWTRPARRGAARSSAGGREAAGGPLSRFVPAILDGGEFSLRRIDADASDIHFVQIPNIRPGNIAEVPDNRPEAFRFDAATPSPQHMQDRL
jgi:hypothetical protein